VLGFSGRRELIEIVIQTVEQACGEMLHAGLPQLRQKRKRAIIPRRWRTKLRSVNKHDAAKESAQMR
jgi:hypothetical protein